MMSEEKTPIKKFQVSIARETEKTAVATAHGTTLKMSMHGMDPTLGFTAPETVIAGYGACLMTNIGKEAQARSLKIDDVRIDFTATKRNDPVGIENLHCTITLKSAESKDKLNELLAKAISYGTATNAINEGLVAAFDYVFK